MFYLVDITEDTASQIALRGLFQRGEGGARIYQSFCNKDQVVGTSKDYCLIKENQTSQVNEFSTFLHMGRCRSLGSLKSFL